MSSRLGTPDRPAAARAWDRRRILYGDWTWFIRDPLDLLRVAFIAGTIAFALMGRSTAVGLTAAAVLLLTVRVINLPRWFDFSVIAAMTLIAWGTALSLYGQHFVYDNVVHSVSPFFYAPVLYMVLVRSGVLADPQEETTAPYIYAGVFVSTLALGMAVGAGYEAIEWGSDKLLGTHLVKSIDDTGSDLLEGTLGSLAGAALVTVWGIRRWSTRRVAVRPVPTATASPLRAARERLRAQPRAGVRIWRSRLEGLPAALKGAAGIAAGTLLLVWPSPALRTVEVVFGLALLVHAAFDLVELLRRWSRKGVVGRIAEVVAEIAVGTIVLARPDISRPALLYTVGALSVIVAFLEAAALSTEERSERDRWLGGAISAAALAFGVALLGLPRRSFDAMVAAFGLYLVIIGTLRLVRALGARSGRETPHD